MNRETGTERDTETQTQRPRECRGRHTLTGVHDVVHARPPLDAHAVGRPAEQRPVVLAARRDVADLAPALPR